MAAKGALAVFRRGLWTNDLFDLKCPDCLKHCCCYCCSLAKIHHAVGDPMVNDKVAGVAACIGCGCCQLVAYGMKQKGPGEPLPLACSKACCCGACYLHQQYKEVDSVLGSVVNAGAAAVNNLVGRPGQEEMS
mmetsp:Transcript_110282/g.343830  ORF Transcript_110282/g.343830 Transcript_110282/m.343830 type:complete len:133 (-) Transcript_110282:249-647(-)